MFSLFVFTYVKIHFLMILCFVNTSRWGTLLSTGSASAVQTRHQTSADTHCPHGGQTPGQTHTHKNTVYTRFVIKILKSSVLQTSTQDACQGIIGLSDLYYIFRSADIPPCLPQKKQKLTVILCLLRVHWGFGVAVMGGRPAENLCLQISV